VKRNAFDYVIFMAASGDESCLSASMEKGRLPHFPDRRQIVRCRICDSQGIILDEVEVLFFVQPFPGRRHGARNEPPENLGSRMTIPGIIKFRAPMDLVVNQCHILIGFDRYAVGPVILYQPVNGYCEIEANVQAVG
jgi:hypothetical protein